MRTDTLKHGTNQIGRAEFSRGGCWVRIDTYTPNGGEAIRERRFAAGSNDTSPLFLDGVTGHYHADCPSCWLGHSHTVDSHNQDIRRQRGQ